MLRFAPTLPYDDLPAKHYHEVRIVFALFYIGATGYQPLGQKHRLQKCPQDGAALAALCPFCEAV
jgi:hypothetical protein